MLLGMPRIVLQGAEKIFLTVRERMSCTNSENTLAGPYGETYPACHDANEVMNIKAEEVVDSEEDADHLPITLQKIKAKTESCTNSENVLVGLYVETYPAGHDANQAMNIKAEEVIDAQEEADPLPITLQKIKPKCERTRNWQSLTGKHIKKHRMAMLMSM
ncbi:uncharacterized protein LOC111866790 isoform X2 [Cryptotermes secundus]|uniref:uncharacterized protein LOC111866790 isoform X2 n=1 Tax=Cryptotermes secundus TaxID=105785 RepID=UPI000CD7DD7C|nr:uncharacterized protein LOC111866790 isoform X2 [Cryptotermes secundus]